MENSDRARGTAPRTIIRAFLGLSVLMLIATLAGCPGVPISHTADSAPSGSAPAAQSSATTAPAPTTPAMPAAVPAKALSSGAVMLSWQAPTENEDGTPIEGLAGYYIHFGSSAAELDQLIEVGDAASTSYEITGLTSGTYYFAVSAYNVFGIEGVLSNIANKSF